MEFFANTNLKCQNSMVAFKFCVILDINYFFFLIRHLVFRLLHLLKSKRSKVRRKVLVSLRQWYRNISVDLMYTCSSIVKDYWLVRSRAANRFGGEIIGYGVEIKVNWLDSWKVVFVDRFVLNLLGDPPNRSLISLVQGTNERSACESNGCEFI